MFKIPLPHLKEKIVASGKIGSADLELRIRNKINELSGLISEEGAAHIIANELGVEMVSSDQVKLKMKEVYAGMRGITVVGKVIRKFEVREFAKGDRTGKVCSLIIGDETGTVRVVFWNEQVGLLEKVKENDIIQVKNVYVRENNNAREIHMGEKSELTINPAGESVDSVRQEAAYERKKIENLVQGSEGVELVGTVVQVFDPRFFQVCPQCAKRVNEADGIYHCVEHGGVEPALSYVMNLVLDDGTGTIRSVFWKQQVNHLLEKSEDEMKSYKDNLTSFEEVKTNLLGEQFKLMGWVKKNEMFDRVEFNVQLIEKANPEEEMEKLSK